MNAEPMRSDRMARFMHGGADDHSVFKLTYPSPAIASRW